MAVLNVCNKVVKYYKYKKKIIPIQVNNLLLYSGY